MRQDTSRKKPNYIKIVNKNTHVPEYRTYNVNYIHMAWECCPRSSSSARLYTILGKLGKLLSLNTYRLSVGLISAPIPLPGLESLYMTSIVQFYLAVIGFYDPSWAYSLPKTRWSQFITNYLEHIYRSQIIFLLWSLNSSQCFLNNNFIGVKTNFVVSSQCLKKRTIHGLHHDSEEFSEIASGQMWLA